MISDESFWRNNKFKFIHQLKYELTCQLELEQTDIFDIMKIEQDCIYLQISATFQLGLVQLILMMDYV